MSARTHVSVGDDERQSAVATRARARNGKLGRRAQSSATNASTTRRKHAPQITTDDAHLNCVFFRAYSRRLSSLDSQRFRRSPLPPLGRLLARRPREETTTKNERMLADKFPLQASQ